jgi:hypothetical protein
MIGTDPMDPIYPQEYFLIIETEDEQVEYKRDT